jgi:protein phosphatase
MSRSENTLYCANPDCPRPINPLGQSTCAGCQARLTYRYLWAAGGIAAQVLPGQLVAHRYYVTAPHIWLDTKPALLPDHSTPLAPDGLPYLYLYPQRLHVPEVYGICPIQQASTTAQVLLLENVPITSTGTLCPAIANSWSQVSPVRQLYWLWQMVQLWQPLSQQGVVSSLLDIENLRTDEWRIRLCELKPSQNGANATHWASLAAFWLEWFCQPQSPIPDLHTLCLQLQNAQISPSLFREQLNRLLIQHAAQLPLHLEIVGVTDRGIHQTENEDHCYPITAPTATTSQANGNHASRPELQDLIPHLALICDGVGYHERGGIASLLAVQALKPQVRAFLSGLAHQTELLSPETVSEHLDVIVRVVNNLIAAQNNAQHREDRQRMATTLLLLLQLPQRDQTLEIDNSHELYLINIGDSRCYWITPRSCSQLTIDDNVAVQDVCNGSTPYRRANRQAQAKRLTQVLGLDDAEFLSLTVQRFILEEDGLLLLCSDGLSDNELVEQSWEACIKPLFTGDVSLEAVARSLITLANQHNGHNNTSIILLRCQIAATAKGPVLLDQAELQPDDAVASPERSVQTTVPGLEFGSETVLTHPQPTTLSRKFCWADAWKILVVFAIGGLISTLVWWKAAPYQRRPIPHPPELKNTTLILSWMSCLC